MAKSAISPLLAMQKVVGSSPISRFGEALQNRRVFSFLEPTVRQ
jgi:hypothetical protein